MTAPAPVQQNAAVPQQQQQQGASMEKQREAARLFRVHQTVCEMLTDRGYEFPAKNDDNKWLLQPNLEEFKEKVLDEYGPLKRNTVSFVLSRPGDNGGDRKSVLVWYEGEDIKTEVVKKIIGHSEALQTQSIIIISANTKIQPIARAFIDQSNREGNNATIEVFPEEHMTVNITKHELVPKHEPLTAEETKKVLDAFALNISQLPRLLASDPVALYFGLKRGQVVKITRKSETAGQYVMYRQVV